MKLKAARDRFKRTGYWYRLTPEAAVLHLGALERVREEAQEETDVAARRPVLLKTYDGKPTKASIEAQEYLRQCRAALAMLDREITRMREIDKCLNGSSREAR